MDSSVSELSGVGAAVAGKLTQLGIETIADLLRHYPRRYDDYSQVTPVALLHPGQVTVKGRISQVTNRRTRSSTTLTEALISDDSGEVKAVWFNQPYLAKQLPHDGAVYLSGELAFKYQQYALQNPVVERVSNFTKDTARIVPVYPETAGLSSKQLRRLLAQALQVALPEVIPLEIRQQYRLLSINQAIAQIHFPSSVVQLEAAKYRLGFEEVYLLQLVARSLRDKLSHEIAPRIKFDLEATTNLLTQLPFKLTNDQRKVAWRIMQDLDSERPMNRLLQGDVGSGKTVVAALAAQQVARAGRQTVLLAPTELLARQHFETLCSTLSGEEIKVDLLVSSIKGAQRREVLQGLSEGRTAIVVGTHALLEKEVVLANLGLVIIDEQHRFGVRQRQAIQQMSPTAPHLLSMSATPIPRSLALTAYGDLDISSIRELPIGRKPIKTEVSTNARQVYAHIYEQIKSGRQVYVVCPLIEDSAKSEATSVATQIKQLKQYWRDVRIAPLHGRLKAEEKAATMRDFSKGKIDVLVATTVVEVGVDVSNATIMLIEGAERFGLATLHQLRGRVGRGRAQSYCYLKTSASGQARQRLQLMERYQDGFILAEQDLELRGPGEIYGQHQHGALDLRMARLNDLELLTAAKTAAQDTPLPVRDATLRQTLARLQTRLGTN